MDNKKIFRIVRAATILLILVVFTTGFIKILEMEKRLDALTTPVDSVRAEGLRDIAAEAERLSSGEASFESILALAKRGGKVTTFAIFYNDAWRETNTEPYSLILEYENESNMEIRIDRQKSLKDIFTQLGKILLSIHLIEE